MNFKKVTINPALIAALRHYAKCVYKKNEPHIFVYTDEDGVKHLFSLEQACALAAKVFEDEQLYCLKFMKLRNGMKREQIGWVYERIMGEKIDD